MISEQSKQSLLGIFNPIDLSKLNHNIKTNVKNRNLLSSNSGVERFDEDDEQDQIKNQENQMMLYQKEFRLLDRELISINNALKSVIESNMGPSVIKNLESKKKGIESSILALKELYKVEMTVDENKKLLNLKEEQFQNGLDSRKLYNKNKVSNNEEFNKVKIKSAVAELAFEIKFNKNNKNIEEKLKEKIEQFNKDELKIFKVEFLNKLSKMNLEIPDSIKLYFEKEKATKINTI